MSKATYVKLTLDKRNPDHKKMLEKGKKEGNTSGACTRWAIKGMELESREEREKGK